MGKRSHVRVQSVIDLYLEKIGSDWSYGIRSPQNLQVGDQIASFKFCFNCLDLYPQVVGFR